MSYSVCDALLQLIHDDDDPRHENSNDDELVLSAIGDSPFPPKDADDLPFDVIPSDELGLLALLVELPLVACGPPMTLVSDHADRRPDRRTARILRLNE